MRKDPRFDDSDFNVRNPWRDWFGGGGADVFKLGKADANIATRTSGTVSIYTGSLGSETDSTSNITAFNITDQQADSGAWVLLIRVNNEWALLPLVCPA